MSQHQLAQRTRSGNAFASVWMRDRQFPSSATLSDVASSAAVVPSESIFSRVSPFEMTELMPSSQQTGRPSDLFPMPITLAQPMLAMDLDKAWRSPQNSPVQLAFEEARDLPFQSLTQTRGSSQNGQEGVLVSPPMVQMDNALQSNTSAHSELAGLPGMVSPPPLEDDPMLAKAMQQAQMGLFVLSGREKSLQVSSHNFSGEGPF